MALGSIALPDYSIGTSLTTRQSLLPSVPEADVQPMSAMDSVSVMFADMRDSLFAIAENTLKTNDLLETAILGTPEQQRDADISAEDRDPAPGKEEDEEQGPGFLSRLGNQTKGFFGSILGKASLAGLALLGSYVFEDEIIEGVGKFFKYMKEDFIPDIKNLYEDVKTWWSDTWAGVKTFFAFIKGIFDDIKEYVMSFDIKGEQATGAAGQVIDVGDGLLDKEEMDNLLKDIKTKFSTFVTDLIGDFFTQIMPAIGGALLGATFIGATIKSILKAPAMNQIFKSSKGFIGPTTPPPGMGMRLGAILSQPARAMPIAGLLLYGITTTYMNVADSYAKTLEENNGEFEFKKFFANFFGGKDEGGFLNGLAQAFKVGGTGALAGMSTGAMIGAFGGPIGIIGGGLIGLAIGAVGGGITGYLGSDKLENIMTSVEEGIGGAMDSIGGLFTDTIDGLNNIAQGGSFSDSKVETAKLRISQFMENNPTLDLMNMSYEQAVDELKRLKDEDIINNRQFKTKLTNLKTLYGKNNLGMQNAEGEKVGAIAYLKNAGVNMTAALQTQLTDLSAEYDSIMNMSDADYIKEYNIKGHLAGKSGARGRKLIELNNLIKELEQDLNILQTLPNNNLETINGLSNGSSEGSGANVVIDSSNKSQNIKKDDHYYSGQSPYPFLSQGYISGVTN